MKVLLFLSLVGNFFSVINSEAKRELKLVTFTTKENDGFKQYLRSLEVYGLATKVLGKEDCRNDYQGKLSAIRSELEMYKDQPNVVFMYTDSDVIFTGGEREILEAFDSMNAKIVFGADSICFPDEELKEDYPSVPRGYKYLNSGGYIGYAPYLYELLSSDFDEDFENYDQLYFTNTYLDQATRSSLHMKLDNLALIFQNLHNCADDMSLDIQETDTRLVNNLYNNKPLVIHGDKNYKHVLNTVGNYLARSWSSNDGYMRREEGRIYMEDMQESNFPKVLIGIFIESQTPFLEEALVKISDLNYPAKKIILFVYNSVEIHDDLVRKWVYDKKNDGYSSVKLISRTLNINAIDAKKFAIDKCLNSGCDFYFHVASNVQLDNPHTLQLLISYNRPILAPIVSRDGSPFSNFWGDVSEDGFYERSKDYMEIVENYRRGIWVVPYIGYVYLISRSVLEDPDKKPNYDHKTLEGDIAMAANMRLRDVFMYAINLEDFGHLVDNEDVPTDHLFNDLWQVEKNPAVWEQRYLHPDYHAALQPDTVNEMPCNDVFLFPLFTRRFCKEMIATMEDFGVWSGGKNEDPRLVGGLENVTTDDIHMNQVGFEDEWLFILQKYIKPFAQKVFIGHDGDATAYMNFVVRYTPNAQAFLRPHHDHSTYTINVGLNRPGVDYEGGGSRFLRQNCSVTGPRIGWTLVHPGQLTHYHEELETTRGKRYIIVSFIDPPS